MDGKVNFECPYCSYVVTLSFSDLLPGMWCECVKCDRKFRITEQDIRHLQEAIKKAG